MATPILKVITEYCEGYINDERIAEVRESDPALYLRNMWFYLRIAISLFNHPTEIQRYLVGTNDEPKLEEPSFADTSITAEADIEGSETFALGDGFKGYELASCRERVTEINGRIGYYMVDFEYDPETGNVTVNGNYPEGTIFDFDFANDGEFSENLSGEIMDILGTGSGLAWREHFNADWLSIVSKVEDKSFKEQNRATDKRANTEQIEKMRMAFAGKMRRFEQNTYYKNRVPQMYRVNI